HWCAARRVNMEDALAEGLCSAQERVLAISHQIQTAQRRARWANAGVPVKQIHAARARWRQLKFCMI
ncbi:MAG: hypothetical protein ACKPKO_48995, partial [Candidatus Fonsibacter sp.]